MKRFILVLLGGLLTLPVSAFYYTYGAHKLAYTRLSNNTCAVSSGSNYDLAGDVIIPDVVTYKEDKEGAEEKEYKVVEISNYGFSGCEQLTSIHIPASVTQIGRETFNYCNSLMALDVDENNSAYCSDDGILFNKDKTTLVKYPDAKPFENNKYVVPNTVKVIGAYAFHENKNSTLTSLIIGDDVVTIESHAFRQCSGLKSVEIGNSVETIGSWAFENCYCLESIKLGNSIRKIESRAFSGCYELRSCSEIPASADEIGVNAFASCYKLPGIEVNAGNKNYCSVDGVLFNKDKTTLIQYFDTQEDIGYIIPNTVTTVGVDAFGGFSSLKLVEIPSSVTTIEEEAFSGCGFTNIQIPNSVTNIGKGAFNSCNDLKSIVIPNSITTIPNVCFFCCFALTSVELPNTITAIGSEAFGYCRSLTKIKVSALNPPLLTSANTFYNNSYNKATLYVPQASLESYKSADVWSNFKKIEADPDAAMQEIDVCPTIIEAEVYSLSGKKVGNSLDGLPKGVYIIRCGNESTKVIL